MSVAGIVIYEVTGDGSLRGRWTHADLRGKTALETAIGGPCGALAGDYRVDIQLPDGACIFEGTLRIREEGEAFSLTWDGTQLRPASAPATYTGVGLMVGATLAATFQSTPP